MILLLLECDCWEQPLCFTHRNPIFYFPICSMGFDSRCPLITLSYIPRKSQGSSKMSHYLG